MSKESTSVRILIADDHAIFRDGLTRLLESEPAFSVCGEAADGYEAVQLVGQLKPDLLLLDLAMPGPGLEVLTRLSALPDRPRTIVLTAATDATIIIRAFQLGCAGFVLKESATRVLFDSIRCVMNGGYWAGKQAGKDLEDALALINDAFPRRRFGSAQGLTSRELELIAAVRKGATNKEIATQLNISEHTVKNHLSSIFNKLGVSSRLELGMLAQDTGLAIEDTKKEPDA